MSTTGVAPPGSKVPGARVVLAHRLLRWSPVVVLLFPQGTIQRSGLPEATVAAYLLITTLLVLFTSVATDVPLGLRRRTLHPTLLLLLVYLLILSPCWALANGAVPLTVLFTAIGFGFLAVHYLLALSHAGREEVQAMGRSTIFAACVVAVLIVFVGSAPVGSESGRATGIAGARTLIYPILPMGAVAAFTLFLLEQRHRPRYGFAFLLCSLAAVLTVTRSMLLTILAGCLLAVLAVPFVRGGGKEGMAALRRAVSILVAGALASTPWWGIWAKRVSPDSVEDVMTIVGRVEEIAAFKEAFIESPLVGRGIGARIISPQSYDFLLSMQGLTVPHNHLAFFAGTTGLVGMVLYYFVVVGAPVRLLLKALRRRIPPTDVPMALALGLAGLVGVAFTLASTTYSTFSYNLSLATVIFASRILPLD
jgi:O-antigen ligase